MTAVEVNVHEINLLVFILLFPRKTFDKYRSFGSNFLHLATWRC